MAARVPAIRVVGLLVLCLARAASAGTLIVDATIYDGTGSAPRTGDVRIERERIAAVGALSRKPSDTVVEAQGLALAPGFIDTHSHHDQRLFEQPDALAAVSQGVTTIVVGQDGAEEYPLEQLFSRADRQVALNVAAYAGHGTIRDQVMGKDFRRVATPEEIERMRKLVARAMRAGALGLSTGLEYDPGIYASREEVRILAREAGRHGGRYISHIRSEDRYLWEALDEIVEVGRVNRMPVQVSHMKLAMVDWWGQADRFIAVLDKARAAGVDITGDVYPYEYWNSTITVLFPDRNFSDRGTAEFALRSLVPPEQLILSRFSPERGIEGLSLAQIAARRGTSAPDTLMALIAESQVPGAHEEVIATSMRADDIEKLIAWPHSNICSDGNLNDTHPRGAGAFTRVLREMVRERKVLTLEEAIRKMTGASASHVGLVDRGVIRPGAFADLVLFDAARVADRSTVREPQAQSVGIDRVWVNGSLVFASGGATGAHPGRALRRASKAR
ncbi:MAG: D-aminoacylase [Gammaproteobacteria bacterium]